MVIDYSESNSILSKNLQALSEQNKDFWSFRGSHGRAYGHGLFQYPAMMVPKVTETIIDKIIGVDENIEIISDPFAGSGTVLTESMLRGRDFYGTDINPLAILLCQVKSGPFYIEELDSKINVLLERINADKKTNIEVDFNNRNKWFTKSAQIWLSKIRRAIQAEDVLWARRFFWVALAETIRLISNSRTSTFKLHIRPTRDIEERKLNINTLNVFIRTLNHSFEEYTYLSLKLQQNDLLEKGHYKKNVQISFADVRTFVYTYKSDVIITSPPYGDNDTTVPYGQHSYLPLQWIDFMDIDPILNKYELLKTTHEIDGRSLGGHRTITTDEVENLFNQSNSLKQYINNLCDKPNDRRTRVITFFRDLNKCIDPILRGLNDGGIMVWILGNRKVGGQRVPLDMILTDLFANRNASVFCELTRKIPSKRMALKNNIADTMSDEIILLIRKAL
jgi:hypothetical protein